MPRRYTITYRSAMPRPTRRIMEILLGAILLHLIWIALALLMDSAVLPMPWAVWEALPNAWAHSMPQHLGTSLGRIAQGVVYSLAIAVGLSLVVYRWRTLGRILDAFIYLSYPIPKLALLPVVMLLAGLGETAKVMMIMLIVLFQLIVGIRDSLRAVPPEAEATLRSLGASMWAHTRYLLLPAITPGLLSALRVAIGTAISVLFVTETYGTSFGMGYYIIDAWMRVNYLDMYAGIVVLSLTGFALFVAIDLLEYSICRWRR